MDKLSVKTLCRAAILIAIEIVLSRFLSFSTMELKIGFGFVPIALCGFMYGPVISAFAGALADFLGAVLFPIGNYFVGFTLTAALTGLCFGLFLHRRKVGFFPNMVLCALINCLILSLGLNTYWVSLITGTPFFAQAVVRLPQFGINLTLQLVLLPLLKKLSEILKRGYV